MEPNLLDNPIISLGHHYDFRYKFYSIYLYYLYYSIKFYCLLLFLYLFWGTVVVPLFGKGTPYISFLLFMNWSCWQTEKSILRENVYPQNLSWPSKEITHNGPSDVKGFLTFLPFFCKFLHSIPSGSISYIMLWTRWRGTFTLYSVLNFWFMSLYPSSFPGSSRSFWSEFYIVCSGTP